MKYSFKAKEQVYNGVKFRSTLEARWAVFFDACGLDWVYEPECFELEAGSYTPDFYLKDYDLYVEIKPNLDWYDDKYDFFRYLQCPGKLLVLSVPFPSIKEASAVFGLWDHIPDRDSVDGDCKEWVVIANFCPNSKYEPFFFCGHNIGESDDYWNDDYKNEINAVKKHRFF
jgi:hypothetical protein